METPLTSETVATAISTNEPKATAAAAAVASKASELKHEIEDMTDILNEVIQKSTAKIQNVAGSVSVPKKTTPEPALKPSPYSPMRRATEGEEIVEKKTETKSETTTKDGIETLEELKLDLNSDADLRLVIEKQQNEIKDQNVKIQGLTDSVSKLEKKLKELTEVKMQLEALSFECSDLREEVKLISKAFTEKQEKRTEKMDKFIKLESGTGGSNNQVKVGQQPVQPVEEPNIIRKTIMYFTGR